MCRAGKFGYIVVLILLWTLVACQVQPPVSVDSRRPPPSKKINYHIVAKGDTLYSIAWRYELNYHDMARANGLGASYTIYPGQKLTLDTSYRPSPRKRSTKNAADRPITKKSPESGSTAKAQRSVKPQLPVKTQSSAKTSTGWRWKWPVKGRISQHYDARGVLKGINIDSGQGTPVKAAGPGVVVYAGSGLRGYGQLIILKHNDIYLSAYAYNRKLLVREGQNVAAQQTIAKVGGDNKHSGRLYFEIRRDGKPVNPTKLLPLP